MRSFRLCLPLLVCLAGALTATLPARAQSAPPAEIADLVETCAACHGATGLPDDPAIPIIQGQHFYYLYVQLKDFAAGRRDNEIMTPMAQEFDRDTMKALAQYFSEQPWPAIDAKVDKAEARIAENAVVAGACTACHLGGFVGNSRVPKVSGQQPDYIAKTLSDFKSGARANAPSKSALFDSTSPEEIAALAKYLAAM